MKANEQLPLKWALGGQQKDLGTAAGGGSWLQVEMGERELVFLQGQWTGHCAKPSIDELIGFSPLPSKTGAIFTRGNEETDSQKVTFHHHSR